jgi:hypothetical protein
VARYLADPDRILSVRHLFGGLFGGVFGVIAVVGVLALVGRLVPKAFSLDVGVALGLLVVGGLVGSVLGAKAWAWAGTRLDRRASLRTRRGREDDE